MRKATGSYRTYSSLVKLQPLLPEFAVEDLSFGRTAALVPGFAVKDLPLGKTLMIYIHVLIYSNLGPNRFNTCSMRNMWI